MLLAKQGSSIIVAHHTAISHGLRAIDHPVTPKFWLRFYRKSIGHRHKSNQRIMGSGDRGMSVPASGPARQWILHIGRPRAKPRITHQNILNRAGAVACCYYQCPGLGICPNDGQFYHPLFRPLDYDRYLVAGKLNRYALPQACPAPDWVCHATL